MWNSRPAMKGQLVGVLVGAVGVFGGGVVEDLVWFLWRTGSGAVELGAVLGVIDAEVSAVGTVCCCGSRAATAFVVAAETAPVGLVWEVVSLAAVFTLFPAAVVEALTHRHVYRVCCAVLATLVALATH